MPVTDQLDRLIAIMLGRLEMDVDACIRAYTQLMEDVFEERTHRFPASSAGRMQARFDSKKLKDAIEKVITDNQFSPADRFNQGGPRGCRV